MKISAIGLETGMKTKQNVGFCASVSTPYKSPDREDQAPYKVQFRRVAELSASLCVFGTIVAGLLFHHKFEKQQKGTGQLKSAASKILD